LVLGRFIYSTVKIQVKTSYKSYIMCPQGSSSLRFAFGQSGLLPQEERLEIAKKQKKLIIGIPKENEAEESRVALTPEAVELLVDFGHEVIVESNAGKSANYIDTDYSERGAFVVKDKNTVFQADIILKLSALTVEEIGYLKGQQTVFSSLLLMNQTEEFIRNMMLKKITAIAYENIKDEHNCYPVVRAMSSISGTTSILIAAEYLSNVRGGKGVLLGGVTGITPTEVVIIGAGTASEFAVRAAIGLGANVKVFDNSIHSLVQLQNNIGMRLYTSVFHPQVLEKSLKSADVLIGARQSEDKNPRFYVTEEMVKGMKKGSVIVDISISSGGCIETSECRTQQDPAYTRHGIIHYSVPNLPSRVARTSSIALSNIVLPLLLKTAEYGGITQHIKQDINLRNGIYMFNGILTNQFIGNYFDIPSKDIDLLMAAF
jgi:alanine dehydrogenase